MTNEFNLPEDEFPVPVEILQMAEETIDDPSDRRRFRAAYEERVSLVDDARIFAERGVRRAAYVEKPWAEQFLCEGRRLMKQQDPTGEAWWFIAQYRMKERGDDIVTECGH
ncbi:hypothetical protein [Streptomyces sp. ISL-100]|uniref:hypothetical protein n=1 Tax=Streptomyces sp. ISL-100 TaxID=2819173 RepID=UPI001BECB9BE|nr:hypothetical protein [Streptomyces sp. ISL-100]MBT2401272.1 hypothetical protein [Streptomyces sp. ISL-100]